MLKKIFSALLSTLFPRRMDATVVGRMTDSELLRILEIRRERQCTILLPYTDVRVRACVHEVKFHENQKALQLLSQVVHTYIGSLRQEYVVIPIPLSSERKKKRGYNQVTIILKEALKNTENISLETDILYKKKDTAPQTTLKRSERQSNVEDVFAVYDTEYARQKISGAHIIILDDVMTTGATLSAAKAALLPLAPASITLVAIAH